MKQEHPSEPGTEIYEFVGVLLSLWHNKDKKVKAKNLGTAFMVSDRLALTCTHNIYSEILRSYAD